MSNFKDAMRRITNFKAENKSRVILMFWEMEQKIRKVERKIVQEKKTKRWKLYRV